MTVSIGKARRLGGLLVLVSAVATLTIPLAQAGHQDLGANYALPLNHPDVFERAVRSYEAPVVMPDVFERTVAAGAHQYLPSSLNVAAVDGFDWRDAGLGAAGGTVISLLLAGVVLALRGSRRRSGQVSRATSEIA